jgi:NodT family efflux transporter outer membrane factor (OMF) lipoprotein
MNNRAQGAALNTASMKDRYTPFPRAVLLASACLTAQGLAGCAAIPHDEPQAQPITAQSAGLSGEPAMAIGADWWLELSDPQLNAVMAEALAGSPSLASATARIRRAQAALFEQKSGLAPRVGGDVNGRVERLSGQSTVPPPYGGTVQFVGSAQASLTWSLDLAGRQRSLIAHARALTEAAALDAAAARETLAGAVAQAYFEVQRAEARRAVTDEFVHSRTQSLELAKVRRRAGLGSEFEIQTSSTLLAEAKQQEQRAEAARARAVHALAALAGRGPDYYVRLSAPARASAAGLALPATLPADLLARRADIRAAQARIEAAGAARGAVRADFFPNVDLKAFIGLAAIGVGSLLSADATTAGAGPAIHLPIFDGGRLRARYRGATADIDLAVTAYNETVVEAVRESADALTAVSLNAADLEEQRKIVAGLERTFELDRVRFRTGLGSRLDVLSAEERLLAAREQAADLQADGNIARVRLITALGGGFAAAANSSVDIRRGE